eukprot:COSAG01_NODE_59366_length_300_cov_1.761194_1_plen_40_part_01
MVFCVGGSFGCARCVAREVDGVALARQSHELWCEGAPSSM